MESKDRILNEAVSVFAEKGKHGAVIEEIASRAEINKAMVYYYFGGREGLYRATLAHVLTSLMETMHRNLRPAGMDPADPAALIEAFTRSHYRTVSANPDWVRVFLGALTSDPETVREVISEVNRNLPATDVRRLMNILDRGATDGTLRRVDTAQLVLSILGMNLFFVFGRPMAETVLNLRVSNEEQFHRARLESIVDLVLHGVLQEGRDAGEAPATEERQGGEEQQVEAIEQEAPEGTATREISSGSGR